MEQIVQIDIRKIDAEIEKLQAEISQRQIELELKQQFREYAIKSALPNQRAADNKPLQFWGGSGTPIIDPAKIKQELDKLLELGISAFIIRFIESHGKVDTRTIIQAYADSVHKPYNDIRNNVFNTLNRLKKADKIEAIESDDSNISIYSIKQNRAGSPVN